MSLVSSVTTFTLDAVDEGSSTHLTIATDFLLDHGGLRGFIER